MARRFNVFFFCMLLYSCSSQTRQNNENVFAVNITNKTLFDIELIDDSRIVSRAGIQRVSLPVFHNELQDGYAVNYRVNLLPEIFIAYRRNENIIINKGQDAAVIDAPDFDAEESFIKT